MKIKLIIQIVIATTACILLAFKYVTLGECLILQAVAISIGIQNFKDDNH